MVDRESVLRLMAVFFKARPKQLAGVVLMQTVAGILESASVLALLPIIHLVLEKNEVSDSLPGRLIAGLFDAFGQKPSLGGVLALVAIIIVIKIVFQTVTQLVSFNLARDIVSGLRRDIVAGLMRANWRHLLEVKTGRVLNLLGAEAERARPALNNTVGVITEILQMVLYLGSAIMVSWQLTLAALALGIVKFAVLTPLQNLTRRAGREQSRSLNELSSRLVEALHMVKPVKAMAREEYIAAHMVAEVNRHEGAQTLNYNSQTALKNLDELFASLIMLGVIFFTAMVVGDLGQLAVVALLMNRILSKVGAVQKGFATIAAHEGALSQLRETAATLTRECEQVRTGRPAPSLEQGIRLADVSLAYGSKVVLDGVSLDIPARRLTALVGPSGSGKTTLIDVILGLIPTDSGRVEVDGVPLGDIDLSTWRGAIGYVPQDMTMCHDTIRANLTLYAPGYGDDDIRKALAAAEALDFVNQQPEGLDTIIGERGMKLSGGQRQRLSIARALLGSPSLLVLDEATTALDANTEAEICQTLKRLSHDVTIIAISHQPAITGVADIVHRLNPVPSSMPPMEANA